ncbi:MAG TPA: hypothetical protein VHL79_18485 [Ramlibacter sp.]|jgi:hypothetical protein|nr:hypothetical protein [Ramlibacter sp.]
MQLPLSSRRPALSVGRLESSREGRDSELSWRTTMLLLFPRLDARPGPWLLFLASVCSYVAIRALELGHF